MLNLNTPGARGDQTLSHNMKLLAHHELNGFGGMGEGMSLQKTSDGRRILWMAHESAPKNFTGVDVTDPRNPKVIVQTELPHAKVRSNSLDVVGDLMAVAYQTQTVGMQPAGVDLFDVSKPEQPRLLSHFDCSGPHSRGVHAVWFVDGKYVHMAAGAPDFQPRNPLDDQFYRILDVSNPSKPVEAGRWWVPGQHVAGGETPQKDPNINLHNPNFVDGNLMYLSYGDAGMVVLDISDVKKPKLVSQTKFQPRHRFDVHTVSPDFKRKLVYVNSEAVISDCKGPLDHATIVDVANPAKPFAVSRFPVPVPPAGLPYRNFCDKGGRFGPHNMKIGRAHV